MRTIKPSALIAWATKHGKAAPALLHWFKVAKKAKWKNLTEVRQDFPHADSVRVGSLKPVIVFNLGGNNYRLITAIHFNAGRVYLLDFLTHAEYSKDTWKNRL